jgi:hypothetical protein
VLGGYSLGAVAADLVIAVTKPGFGFNDPLPPGLDQHVAAVALFGNGTRRVLSPVPDFSSAFAGKTIEELRERRSDLFGWRPAMVVTSAARIHQLRTGRPGRQLRSRQTLAGGCTGEAKQLSPACADPG